MHFSSFLLLFHRILTPLAIIISKSVKKCLAAMFFSDLLVAFSSVELLLGNEELPGKSFGIFYVKLHSLREAS